MVKLIEIVSTEQDGKSVVSLFADTKAEVSASMNIIGFNVDKVSAGSMILTADADLGFVKSDGTINWVDAEE